MKNIKALRNTIIFISKVIKKIKIYFGNVVCSAYYKLYINLNIVDFLISWNRDYYLESIVIII